MKVLVDISQFLTAYYLAAHDSTLNEGLLISDLQDGTRKYVMEKIDYMVDKFDCKYKDVVLCCDGSHIWRYKIFPFYKASRKKKKSNVDFEYMKEFFANFIEECKIFPFKTIKVEGAEGDDIISVLSKRLKGEIYIASTDKDMMQLIKENVWVYNQQKDIIMDKYKMKSGKNDIILPVKTKSDAKKMKIIQILKGDDSDGVPNILSDDDTFVNPTKKQKTFGYKKIMDEFINSDEGSRNFKKIIEENEENYKRNRKLVDMDCIPRVLEKKIVDEYVSIQKSFSFDSEAVNNYLNGLGLDKMSMKIIKEENKTKIF